jgi:hypothetical protein
MSISIDKAIEENEKEMDEGMIDRCLAAGGKVERDNNGKIIAVFVKPSKLSPDDRARWATIQKRSEAINKAKGVVCVDSPNPAGLLADKRYWFMPNYPPEKYSEAMLKSRYTRAQARVERLMRHEQMREEAERLAAALPVKEGMVSSDPFWSDLAHAEMLALAYDAATPVLRDRKRQRGARRGGLTGGLAKAADAEAWHSKVVQEARRLLEGGKSPRDLASILAARFSKSARTIREVLKKAEVK